MIRLIILTLFNNNPQTPFNTNEIIQRVVHHPVKESNKILIKDKAYDAVFQEANVVLKTETKETNILLDGKPEIKNGKVIYRSFHGDIAFEGTDKGLKFEQSSEYPSISAYSTDASNLCFTSSKSGEFLIDTNVAYTPVLQNKITPVVAFDGTNYFIAWQDQRQQWTYAIYGTRVTPDGEILDSAGIFIFSTRLSAQLNITFGGTNYFLVWADYRKSTVDLDIYGARVTPTGQVLDPAGIAISTTTKDEYSPDVAFDGTNYLVVWEGDECIYGKRITPAGNVLDPSGIGISAGTSPAIAFDGTNYLVVWRKEIINTLDVSDIYGTRVSKTGTVLDPSGICISNAAKYQWAPAVAFDGTNYLVAWTDGRNGPGNDDIYGTRVSTTGTVLNPAGIPISAHNRTQSGTAIGFAGTNYFVIWIDSRNYSASEWDTYGTRVNLSGQVLDTEGIYISTYMMSDIASDGTNFLIVQQNQGMGNDIYSVKVSQTGNVGTVSSVYNTAAYFQNYPTTAFDGNNYLVIWNDYRDDSNGDIYGARITPAGNVLDPSGIAISTVPDLQTCGNVIFNGTDYFTVWEEPCITYGARISTAGQMLDTAGIFICGGCDPKVAFDGTNYLVVCSEKSGTMYDLYGAIVTQTGTLLNKTTIYQSVFEEEIYSTPYYPNVAFDGTNYLVVWTNDFYSISGTRVSKTGTVLDAPILIGTFSGAPSIAFGKTNYLIAGDNEASIVDTAGNVLDTSGIKMPLTNPAVTFDGNKYIVMGECNDIYDDIYGVCISTAGVVSDSFPVSTQIGYQGNPTVTHGNGSEIFVAYSGFTDFINTHPANTMRIWGKLYPYIAVEEPSISDFGLGNAELKIRKNKIYLEVAKAMEVNVKIYDLCGRLKETVYSGILGKGDYVFTSNVRKTGIYFVRVRAGTYKETKKLILIQ